MLERRLTNAILVSSFVCIFYVEMTVANARESNAKRNRFKMENSHLVEVPRKFELSGKDVVAEFEQIVADINHLTKDVSVSYQVRVDVIKPGKRKNLMKTQFEHAKSKHSNKFNVPLSKKNMKLSAYESFMKKMVENDEPSQVDVNRPVQPQLTTTADIQILTTKQLPSGKYKPIIHKYKTNYTKRVKPVRNDIITLIANEFRQQ